MWVWAAAGLGFVGLLPETARALTATNQTTNTIVFSSNGFENDTAGTPPSATGAGSWVSYYTDSVITGGTPGAFAGNNYVSTTRDNGGVGGPEGHFASNQTVFGDHIHLEWNMWIPAAGDEALILHNAATYYRALGRIGGGVYANYNGAAYLPTTLTYTPNAWQTWTLDYTVGAQDYTIGIAGGGSAVAPTLNGISTPGGGPIDGLYFGHNGNDSFFLDGAVVPEPMSAGLLSGAFAMFARRRRA
jgi:hypothetical protein